MTLHDISTDAQTETFEDFYYESLLALYIEYALQNRKTIKKQKEISKKILKKKIND